ncbi:SMI1/KNR4 family protein [Bacillus mycoides]|uniref:SMI1/KNR4 family protein n=1 Tax=Bacillus mycoides TaxID=1405 RepID=UPI00103BC73C|nr:SMI1/KNR4 family protein [Bacillus mycoides]MBJ7994131.1 SMI1/KNR4 family protein [Bacillus cereus]MED1402072.1 SMI1/KNR4 family protein [Bacillus mycoides]QWH83903.1 SMI1/KNR4 family protein [Bacillus mycoides]QWI94311.1 SMI1/KNR4 family protein [Bacillus mycoides]TBX57021.1 SMI1/KNR4 family protein [Bacillus mycoides]
MNNITWSFMSKTPITDEEIQKVEQYFNIKLPNDFAECVKKYDGGYPHPKVFDVPGQDENVFSDLLTLHIEDRYSIVQNYEGIKDRLVDKVYPFAIDPFGNLLCFDYRNNLEAPTVVFWEHEEEEMEKAIYPVCSSFTELLNSLRDYDDE